MFDRNGTNKDTERLSNMQGVDEQWSELIDWGGLWCVIERTYQFFVLLSMQVWKKFSQPSPPSKFEMMQNITIDDDVLL